MPGAAASWRLSRQSPHCAPRAAGGDVLLLDVRETGLTGYEFMRALYRSQRVSVLDGAAFGRPTAGFVRVCFATSEDELDEASRRIRRFCEQQNGAFAALKRSSQCHSFGPGACDRARQHPNPEVIHDHDCPSGR